MQPPLTSQHDLQKTLPTILLKICQHLVIHNFIDTFYNNRNKKWTYRQLKKTRHMCVRHQVKTAIIYSCRLTPQYFQVNNLITTCGPGNDGGESGDTMMNKVSMPSSELGEQGAPFTSTDGVNCRALLLPSEKHSFRKLCWIALTRIPTRIIQ